MSRREERGAAAVLAVQVVALLCVVTVAAVAGVAFVVAHRRAQDAADLAALAGAGALQQGLPACAAVADLLARNHARTVSCEVRGDEVTVRARAPTGVVLGRVRWAEGEARAGPVSMP